MKKSETKTCALPTFGALFIVSAPSGAGKNTLIENFLKNYPYIYKELGSLKRAITYTTKKPRLQDIDGKDYHFISEAEFTKKIEEGFFWEYSTAYGSYYGTPLALLEELESGKSFFIILDRIGALKLSELYKNHILILIAPASIEELQDRLIKRAGESAQEIEKRLGLARLEMALEKENPRYHHYITNDTIELGVGRLKEIVLDYFKNYKNI